MENEKKVTPMEGLNIAVRELMNINVPVGLTEQISFPMARAIELIRQCIPLLQEKPEEKPQNDNEKVRVVELNLDEAEPAEEKSSEEENADA